MKYVSVACRSKGTEAIMIPLRPPSTNRIMKAITKRTEVVMRRRRFHQVAIQQKICAPVGIAIAMEDAEKKLLPIRGKPAANIWWTQSPNERNPMEISDSTTRG